MSRVGGPARDRGSASVLIVGVAVGLVTMLVLALGLVAVLIAGQQARSAADLASLAAAGQLAQGGSQDSACALAAQVAQRQAATVRSCQLLPAPGQAWPEVLVRVERVVAESRWTVTAQARAGSRPLPTTPN